MKWNRFRTSEKNPFKKLRRLRRRVYVWRVWRRQGRPMDGPVVLEVGNLIQQSDGRKMISGWWWDFRYTRPKLVTHENLWEFLADRYPVTWEWDE